MCILAASFPCDGLLQHIMQPRRMHLQRWMVEFGCVMLRTPVFSSIAACLSHATCCNGSAYTTMQLPAAALWGNFCSARARRMPGALPLY